MPASLRELRQRRQSVAATKKITRAMELIAASRIIKAQQAATAALPFTRELNRAVSAMATHAHVDHPLIRDAENPKRAALVMMTSDRGLAGAYSSNVIKTAQRVTERLTSDGLEVARFPIGRKAISWLAFRNLPVEASWEGFSDKPQYEQAHEIADRLIEGFLTPDDEGGFSQIYVVYTRMESMLSQVPRVRRILPLEVVEGVEAPTDDEILPVYEFEPDAETVLDELLPLYVRNRVWFYLLQAAASQLASQQKAMKSATDNAEQLIQRLTREANQARQAEITQEISEIVGGAGALAESSESE
jgi:F-type H+-transporting ATPase subunit gamma